MKVRIKIKEVTPAVETKNEKYSFTNCNIIGMIGTDEILIRVSGKANCKRAQKLKAGESISVEVESKVLKSKQSDFQWMSFEAVDWDKLMPTSNSENNGAAMQVTNPFNTTSVATTASTDDDDAEEEDLF